MDDQFQSSQQIPYPTASSQNIPEVKKSNKSSWLKWVLVGFVIVDLLLAFAYFFFLANTGKSTPQPTSTVAATPTPNSPADWKTYKDDELDFEFKYPPNPLEPMRGEGDTSFVIGYFLDGENPSDFRDVQNPDKTYWISLGYVSQTQLGVMGITYCDAYRNDYPRCESRVVSGKSSIIDWNIPVEYTKINDKGKEEKATQIKASVSIPHPQGGIVTFELQPVIPESKEILYKILSTFKFLKQTDKVKIIINSEEKSIVEGDNIGSMTVASIAPYKESFESIPLERNIKMEFAGKTRITGHYSTAKEGLYTGMACFSDLDKTSEAKIPRLAWVGGKISFCFSNNDFALKTFPAGSSGKATIIIDSYTINYFPSEVVNFAELIEVVTQE